MSLARSLLLALMLVASSLALRKYYGYATPLVHGNELAGILREGQERTYRIDATEDRIIHRNGKRTRVSNLYIKLATCKGSVSVKLYDPRGKEIPMKGRTCKKNDHSIKYHPTTNHKDSYNVKEEHSIWTYHNSSTIPGTYEIVIKAELRPELRPCGKAEYDIMASSKDVRQPPILPEETCIYHHDRFTTPTAVGLKWMPAKLPSNIPYKVIKYCVYMMPEKSHNHKCSNHGSVCSVAKLLTKDTINSCFVSKGKSNTYVNYIVRGLRPKTTYHVDVIAWIYDNERGKLNLPMAYSQLSSITTHDRIKSH